MNLIKRLKDWMKTEDNKPIGNVNYWQAAQEYHKSRWNQ